MSEIKTFSFNKSDIDEIKKYKFGVAWPAVYVLENGDELYIGETVNVYIRSKQHLDNVSRKKLTQIHIISDEEFNKSAALDIESMLIQYMSADGKYKLQNGNGGLQNHNYFDREKYRAKFEITWQKLKEMALVQKDLVQIKNSDVFKYSPYKSLTDDQVIVVRDILEKLREGIQKPFIINGRPGTGKTILAVYIAKYLMENEATKHWNIGLVVPMTSLRSTLKKVFRQVQGLSSNMIIGPSDVIKDTYDLLIVDESHRLKKRVNITNFRSFDAVNRSLGLDNNGTELDWIKKSSKHQILFYDKNQSVRPSDINHAVFNALDAVHYDLVSQLRLEGGVEYLELIESIFDLRHVPDIENKMNNYDLRVFDRLEDMVHMIHEKNRSHGLSRLLAGYAWAWNSKNDNKKYDIEIDGVQLRWNSVMTDWVNSPKSVEEVGCIHTIQGYDLNYAGVIIGPELSYDPAQGTLIINEKKYLDINGKRSISHPDELKRYIINIYKTLLTRGIHGTYLYIVDPELRKYFKAVLG